MLGAGTLLIASHVAPMLRSQRDLAPDYVCMIFSFQGFHFYLSALQSVKW